MDNQNQTTIVTSFVLLGFSYNPTMQVFLFLIFSFMYVITVLGNTMIVMVIKGSSNLHSPMYFFLSHLAFLDICFSSVTVPKLLLIFSLSHAISYNGCLTQMFFIILTAGSEAYLLAAMAYDRFVAICKPLHYVQIMSTSFCRWLVVGAWTIGFGYAMVNTLPVLKLSFCGSNIIRHFSCEFPSVLALSCTDTFLNAMTLLTTGGAVGASSFFIILLSYIRIISTILKMHSAEAKRKTFSTCSSHLIVVILYYGSGLFRYMRPKTASSAIMDTLFSIQYSISTPMLNPIIYSFKTREVKEAIKKLMRCKPLISPTNAVLY
ncbi:olfactory receptor 1G1-like [Sceloporus undulatus]|uniref:olfactory receptor 1G1-like n=1 Tax=Sceloporus undulatus TaxID=8520 RepID=UPI001C4D5D32|nr:olfactory receptor 1G1-like [Sceloporus undulatus]